MIIMADEVHYGSSDSNKRKYDDNQTPPPPRRQTGFSAPISSHSPPVSSLGHQALPAYNSVAPPMDEIQLAKQKTQGIAAWLFNNAEATKRPRVENGGGGGSGFDSMEPVSQKPLGKVVLPPCQVHMATLVRARKSRYPTPGLE